MAKALFDQKGVSYRPKDPEKIFLAIFGKKKTGGKETAFLIEDFRYVLGKVSSKNKLTGFFQFRERLRQGKIILQLKVYLKDGLKLTKKEKVTFKKEVVELLKRVKVGQKRTLSSPLDLKATFSYEDSKVKYKKGKLQYFI